MLALQEPAVAAALREVLGHEPMTDADHEQVVRLVRHSGAIERTEAQAHDFALRARAQLEIFDAAPSRATLERVCDYVVDRRT
jgi:geranylgeranyl pyrophosphate synthase